MDMQQGLLTLFIEKNFGNVVSTNPIEFQAGSPLLIGPGDAGHVTRPRRSLRADRRALAHRSAARSPVLQPRRAERSDRRAAQAAQRGAADPSARCHTPAAARRTRPAGAQAVADRALRLRRMARAPVGIDYHFDVEGHFYSVPYRFARSEVEVRLTGRTVEIFVKG